MAPSAVSFLGGGFTPLPGAFATWSVSAAALGCPRTLTLPLRAGRWGRNDSRSCAPGSGAVSFLPVASLGRISPRPFCFFTPSQVPGFCSRMVPWTALVGE